MIGAITGDIVGSIYEFNNIKTTDFELFDPKCFFTDDSILTIALADAIFNVEDYSVTLRRYYQKYPTAGYGLMFKHWANNPDALAYNSWGNGSAMRISPVGWAFDTLDKVLTNAEKYTAITHNHPEGIAGAKAVAASIFLARNGYSKKDIKKYVVENFGYDLDRSCNDIRTNYYFNESCRGTVPEAIVAFLDSEDFEHSIRLAISLGGDSDTLACINGSIAEAFYRIPADISEKALSYLDANLLNITNQFVKTYCLNK